MKKFEYKLVALRGFNESICNQLNLLGEKGWELVGIDGTSSIFACLKREKNED